MRIRYPHASLALALAGTMAAALAAPAFAVPPITSIVFSERVFNDCPGSTLTTSATGLSSVTISDANLSCFGYANLHTWSYSADGSTKAQFQNGDHIQHGANLVIDGTYGTGEAGLRIAPWWSPDVDGRFNVRVGDGEVAVFGGRLPFYSFTAQHGVVYTQGTDIRLDIIYWPNGLSSSSPGSIEYRVGYNSNVYRSPLFHLDQGNPSEDPPHGLWGLLTPYYVGGYMQALAEGGDQTQALSATWSNLTLTQNPTDAKTSTWGRLKSLYK